MVRARQNNCQLYLEQIQLAYPFFFGGRTGGYSFRPRNADGFFLKFPQESSNWLPLANWLPPPAGRRSVCLLIQCILYFVTSAYSFMRHACISLIPGKRPAYPAHKFGRFQKLSVRQVFA